ncbi:IS110 family transposase [Sulfobacillus thermosulfidooxidans]|uniref:IS110 family transposase n=1 Tax=Sulfobacillus thermosulfidooxidans TaxID=28034 RepID=UPI000318FF4B|nr:transposase [Sulfobacillus thermosulfidooxidans]
MDSVLYVGIDTSLGAHVVCAMAADGQVVARTTVPNDQAGAEQFVAWLHPHAAPYARLAIGVEATSVYHVPLMEWLTTNPRLAAVATHLVRPQSESRPEIPRDLCGSGQKPTERMPP